ncbi:phosphotransferase [Roseivivax sp. THAF30]|uniref:phosphotransferase n=1 Tax=Roseivivax sp. THAF30 TaxID=2587852 RepID=UPI001267E090|nr:phosphotransferase [Roseivivax sp. THAF30]
MRQLPAQRGHDVAKPSLQELASANEARILRVLSVAEAVCGEPVSDVESPGGVFRASLRLKIDGRSVIATARSQGRTAREEALVLRALSDITDRVPVVLGCQSGVLLQSDLGQNRLDLAIARAPVGRQALLAEAAASSLVDLHAAADRTALSRALDPLDDPEEQAARRILSADALAPFAAKGEVVFDRAAVMRALCAIPRAFVKGDCRPANATLGADRRVRWFDFETCGPGPRVRDFAELIVDPVWTLPPDRLFASVGARAGCAHAALSLHTALRAAEALERLMTEAQVHGWQSRAQVLVEDGPGANAAFAARIADMGAMGAGQSRLLEPLVLPFSRAARHFRQVARQPGRTGTRCS